MKIVWQIDKADVTEVKAFFEWYKTNSAVAKRVTTNLLDDRPRVTKKKYWHAMVTCLLTTQQRSGPRSAVSRFVSARPFPLRYDLCVGRPHLDEFVTNVLAEFGGLRRSNIIGRQIKENAEYLERGGWKATVAVLDVVRREASPVSEREAARFIDDNFNGFGPKQSRNLLQELGLSRYEVPIDSRITKWLNEFGFPIKLTANALADRSYFEFASDGFQRLSEACGIMPCVLDAAIFSSFDGDG